MTRGSGSACSTSSTPTTARPTSSSCRATSGTPRRCAGRSTASTSSSTTSRRCRWPGTASSSSRSTSGDRASARRLRGRRRAQGRLHVVVARCSACRPRTPYRATRSRRPAEAYGRAKYEGELLCRAAISRGLDVSDRAAPHDPGPRPAGHLRHPLRLDRRRGRRARARLRRQPLPVRARRTTSPTPASAGGRARARPSTTSAPRSSAPCARRSRHLCRHAGTGAQVRCAARPVRPSPPCGSARARPDARSGRTTGSCTASRCGST